MLVRALRLCRILKNNHTYKLERFLVQMQQAVISLC